MTTTITLRQMAVEHLDRWVRLNGEIGKVHSFNHARAGWSGINVDTGDGSGGISIVDHDPVEVELLHACEACEHPIVDEEPVWGGEDGDEPLHRHCVPDDNPDHALSVPTSEHTVTVPGYGDAAVAEVGGAWNWRCGRDGCGIGAVCVLTVEQAESSARWHLEHEHDPLPADDQRHSDDVATQEVRG